MGLCVGLACALAAFTPSSADAQVDAESVDRAVQRAVRALQQRQLADGTWPEHSTAPGGVTCLAALALLTAGESSASPALRAALEHVERLPDEAVYAVSLKILALAQADAKAYRPQIQRSAAFLARAQQGVGLWSYTEERRLWDHSNSQFALLGLHAAERAGVRVPPGVWPRARERVIVTQNADGGWTYRANAASYGSMTAAGVSDLIILAEMLPAGREKGFSDGAAPRCGQYPADRPLQNGLAWLAVNFRADENPGRGSSWVNYWLYAVERCGILSGRRYFGEHDWYREGAAALLREQNADGSWGPWDRRDYSAVAETSLALLFLAKGRKPLLVQKLAWSADEEWNPDRSDLANLTLFIDDKLGEPMDWQTVDFDAPLEEWLAAPLLYVQGHRFPEWNRAQQDKLRKFVEQGGTLLFEACCSRPEFAGGFEAFARAAFPGAPLRELDPGHGVYNAFFDVAPYGIQGLDVGCRTSVLFSPRDLSCLWEQKDIPKLSERAFELGTNLCAFAIGRRAPRHRLDVVELPSAVEGDEPLAPGGALQLAQLVYEGDWRPDPHALTVLAERLRDIHGLEVITRYRQPHAREADLALCPIVYMSGHFAFELSPAEVAALSAYLRRGGFLFADACCGRAAFDESFRALASRLFPERPLERIEPDHPLLRGAGGAPISRIAYRDPPTPRTPESNAPELYGVSWEGRLALVYSPYALGCGLEGHKCYDCAGLIDDDARRLAERIVLYALHH